MKRLTPAILILFLCRGSAAICQQSTGLDVSQRPASQPLANESVVRLVKAGLSDDTIINIVNSEPGNYSVGVDDIIALKKAGVSDKIISAMVRKSAHSPGLASRQIARRPTATAAPTTIRKVFISGNNEVAVDLRRRLLESSEKYGKRSCFTVVANPRSADAGLVVGQTESAGGVNSSIFGTNSSTVTSTVATGTLTASDGTWLWSDSKQGMAGVVHTGAGDAARNLLLSLYRFAGCTESGSRQLAIAPAPGVSARLSNTTALTRGTPKLLKSAERPRRGVIACQRVFVRGSQAYAVRWALKNLFKKTCMAPQPSLSQATAVLDLESEPGVAGGLFLKNAAHAYLYDAKTHALMWSYEGSDPWDAVLAYSSQCKGKTHFGRGKILGWQCDPNKLPADLLPGTEATAPRQ